MLDVRQGLSRSIVLSVHMRVHLRGERLHECSTCGEAFSGPGKLAVHMRVHSGERPYECSTCGEAFSWPGSLAAHMRRIHSGERLHECSTCGKAFSVSSNLAKHERLHVHE